MIKEISVPGVVYMTFADLILFNANGEEYYSDTITVTEGDVEYTLSLTATIHYDESIDIDSYGQMVATDIVPIWWEITATDAGGECKADFNFDELRDCVKW